MLLCWCDRVDRLSVLGFCARLTAGVVMARSGHEGCKATRDGDWHRDSGRWVEDWDLA